MSFRFPIHSQTYIGHSTELYLSVVRESAEDPIIVGLSSAANTMVDAILHSRR